MQWIPGGGHVAGTARAADAELRTLADNYGLTNLNSAERGRAAKVIKSQPEVPKNREAAMQFAPGFAQVPYVRDRQGGVHSVCAPSMQNVNFKTRVGAEVPLGGGKLGFANPVTNTRFEATHRAKGG